MTLSAKRIENESKKKNNRKEKKTIEQDYFESYIPTV